MRDQRVEPASTYPLHAQPSLLNRAPSTSFARLERSGGMRERVECYVASE